MPFKNTSGYYYAEPVLPGYGKMPRLSLGTTRMNEAKRLEDALRELARRAVFENASYHLILDAMRGRGRGHRGSISPADVLIALREEGGLLRLLRSLDDPLVKGVIDEYLEGASITRHERYALGTLMRYAGEWKFSALCSSEAIQQLLEQIEAQEGKQRNSVCRYEKRMISKLLRSKLGNLERSRIFQDVDYAMTDDRRRLRTSVVSAEAIARLLVELEAGYQKQGDEVAPLYVMIAITTGATIRPLSETPNRLLRPFDDGGEVWGILDLVGTKKLKRGERRDRPILIAPAFALAGYGPVALYSRIADYHNPDNPDAPIFPLIYTRFYTLWKKAVRRAGLGKATVRDQPLRPHDCRRIFGMLAEEAGIERTKISVAGLGHQRLQQTDDYLARETSLTTEEVMRLAMPKRATG